MFYMRLLINKTEEAPAKVQIIVDDDSSVET